MRSLIPILLALACPIGMCLIPMLLMRRRGEQASRHPSSVNADASEVERLRAEMERLRAREPREEDALR